MLNTTALLYLMGCSLAGVRKMRMGDVSNAAEGRIIKGQEAEPREFPFLVGLTRTLDLDHRCGGTIITKNWVLTAAHCCALGQAKCFVVYSGSIDRDGGGQKRFAKKTIIHEHYDQERNFRNDICLIRVFPPFILGKKVQQVTLPRENWEVPTGVKLTAAGWGYTTPNESLQMIPNRMRKLGMIGIDNEQCGEEANTEMIPGYLCAHGLNEGEGICQGDSGGPLMLGKVQVGITSWIYKPCGAPTPDFFVRLPHYMKWVKDKLGLEAFELKYQF